MNTTKGDTVEKWLQFHHGWYVRHVENDGIGSPAAALPLDAMLSEPRRAIAEGGLIIRWFVGRDRILTKSISRFARNTLDCIG